MFNPIVIKYAHLLLDYCVDIKPGDRLLIRSGFAAQPLIKALFQAALEKGAIPEIMIELDDVEPMIMALSKNTQQLDYVPILYREGMTNFDAYIYIKAADNLKMDYSIMEENRNIRQKAWLPYQQSYFKRTADRSLKRTFCVFPTAAAAQEAGMHTEAYEKFVYEACMLNEEDPVKAWYSVRDSQQHWVDWLNQKKWIRYVSSNMDISFSTEGRTWINSYGTTNMPSGEIYTSPVENSVYGEILFDYPLIYRGYEIRNIQLSVRDGEIIRWNASEGKNILDQIMNIPGAKHFGEAAIGTNQRIQRFTKNILFDEKIGGTIHMAIGQSYLQAGGKNQSSIHLDLIADMRRDGSIYADGELIYQQGKFLI